MSYEIDAMRYCLECLDVKPFLQQSKRNRGTVMDNKDFDSLKSVIEEVKRYLDQNVDYFTASSGPWTIEYDNRKESDVKDDKNH